MAACGFITSLFVGRLRSANSARAFPWNPAGQTVRDLGALWSKRSLFLVALGSAYFWTLGSLSQLNIDQFTTEHLFVTEQTYVGSLLAILTLGIGGGALLAGFVSRGKVELGLVPLGGIGIAVTSILLVAVPAGGDGHFPVVGYIATAVLLLGLGMTAGLYDIPLQAFLQDRSPPESRGSIMAAYNFLAFTGMLTASGVYWLLSGPLGLSSPTIFFVGGLDHDSGHDLGRPPSAVRDHAAGDAHVDRLMYRVRVEGLENVPAGGALLVANHVSWADGVLLGLACPRRPAHDRLCRVFPEPLAGMARTPGANHSDRHNSQVDGRVDPRCPRGPATGRAGVHLSRGQHHPQRQDRGVPAGLSVDT